MKGTEPFEAIEEHARRSNTKPELHKTPTGWCVRVVSKRPGASGEAKGRSPLEAYAKLARKLGLEAKA